MRAITIGGRRGGVDEPPLPVRTPAEQITAKSKVGLDYAVGVWLGGGGDGTHVDDRLDVAPAFLKPVEHVLGGNEVADWVAGQVAPLAEVGLAQAIADHHVQAPVFGEAGDDVRADEAGTAGDEDDPAGHCSPSPAIRRIAAVVE